MKRPLSQEEKELSTKALNKHKKLLKDLQDNLAYNKALIDKQNFLRKFDDDWREYLRVKKDEEDKQVFDQIEKEIKNSEEHIKIINDQLIKGVDIKKEINLTG